MKTIKNFAEFKQQLITDPQLQNEFKNDPVKAASQFHDPLPDSWVYRIIVSSLGFAILFVIIAVVILLFGHDTGDPHVPTIFTAIASGAIGALAGLLAPSPSGSQQ